MSVRTSRRTLVTAGAAGLLFSSMASPALAARGRKRAYVLVVDGCRPDEITPTLTPTLAALRDGGLDHPRATSLPIMETIPNHVMMMTGVRPDRNGVPANKIYDRTHKLLRDMNRQSDIRYPTIIIGMVTRFISPLAVSAFWARLATSSDRPLKESEPASPTRMTLRRPIAIASGRNTSGPAR